MKKIILLKSEDRCGKDITASILKYKLEKNGDIVKILPFATLLKDFVANILTVDSSLLDEMKNNNTEVNIDGSNITTRDFIIKVSENIKKHFGDESILNHIKDEISKNYIDVLIIPDIRFKSEYTFITKYSNICIIEIDSSVDECGANGKKYELNEIPVNLILNISEIDFINDKLLLKQKIDTLIKYIF